MAITLKTVPANKDYSGTIMRVVRGAKQKKVCYVTLNRSCGSLAEMFEKVKKEFFYIDGISATLLSPPRVKDCHYVPAAYSLDNIQRLVKIAISKGYTFLVFDSLSNLLIHKQAVPVGGDIIGEFIRSFKDELSKKKGSAVFFVKSSDKKKPLIKEALKTFLFFYTP
ncbi:hypothetical protein HOA55_05335 [archaeon]|jgi:hypothetical protein|nr:hypothetical protein [archaeon]MBT3577745.1 hypothetical protein [archaeon]MBT6820752.1 hypothetical protein [archaeon]MBT6956429.1 hypothetical protein [archaeon]MBT7025892.1 hypothetical protein [archaeon]